MSDLLTGKLVWLWQQLKVKRGVSVTFLRGGASITITVVTGQTTTEITNEHGTATKATCHDFNIEAVDVVFEEVGQVAPASGDKIMHTIGGMTYTYQIMSPGDRPAVEPSQTPGVLRVHTKLIKTE